MSWTKEDVLGVLRGVDDDATGRDLVASGSVVKCAACDGHVSLTVACVEDDRARRSLKNRIEAALRENAAQAGETIQNIAITFAVAGQSAARPAATPAPTKSAASAKQASPSLPGVRHVIAVGAGKGGVGKSTIAVNLAVGLARAGHSVGLLDGDIYGPSLPTLLGLDALQATLHEKMLQPFLVHGIKAITIGKLVDPEKPLIWRGPMAHGAFKQLVEQTSWGELDYLIIDLPPGTGDVSLTMSQLLSLTGAIIVCTPQKVAQDDAVRAARMFQQLNIEVLGVVENMSYFIGDDQKEYDIFGRGGAETMAQRMGLPFLGAVPINMKLREHSDAGTPEKNFTAAGGMLRESLDALVKRVESQVAMATLRRGATAPTLSVS